MSKYWSDKAWDDYLYWQTQDKKTLLKINKLVKDIERNGLSEGIGKPEPLRYRKGWSRRIDEKNRLVYDMDENGNIILGEINNSLMLKISNNKISFLQNGTEVAYMTDNKLYITDGEFLNSLQLGNFAFYPRSSGNLSFKKIK